MINMKRYIIVLTEASTFAPLSSFGSTIQWIRRTFKKWGLVLI